MLTAEELLRPVWPITQQRDFVFLDQFHFPSGDYAYFNSTYTKYEAATTRTEKFCPGKRATNPITECGF